MGKTWLDAMRDIAVAPIKKKSDEEKENNLVEKISNRVIEKLEGVSEKSDVEENEESEKEELDKEE